MMTLTMFIFIDNVKEDVDDHEGNEDENNMMPLTMHHIIIISMIVFLITWKDKVLRKLWQKQYVI